MLLIANQRCWLPVWASATETPGAQHDGACGTWNLVVSHPFDTTQSIVSGNMTVNVQLTPLTTPM